MQTIAAEPKRMQLILAGSYRQAKDYVREHGLASHEARFVLAAEDLNFARGSADVVLVGDYQNRPEAFELIDMAEARGFTIRRAA